MSSNNIKTPSAVQIENFLNGHNNKKYVVAVETYYHKNEADVIIHNPITNDKYVEQVAFKPFIFIKDLKKCGLTLYNDNKEQKNRALEKFGITIKLLKSSDENGQIERLQNGYKYIITTSGSYNDLNNFFKQGGVDTRDIKQKYDSIKFIYDELYIDYEVKQNELEKLIDKIEDIKVKLKRFDDNDDINIRKEILEKINEGKVKGKMTENTFVKNKLKLLTKIDSIQEEVDEIMNNEIPPIKEELDEKEIILNEISKKKDCFYYLGLNEQFMISTGIRLFKGYENYNDIEKFTFDIETTWLDPKIDRIFLIGCKTNKGFQKILSCKKEDDDESERNLILNFFHLLCKKIKPAIMAGYNSEEFDMWFILERCLILKLDLTKYQTTFNDEKNEDGETFLRNLVRKQSNVKFGGDSEKSSKTLIWGINVIDTQNAVRRAKAINSEIKEFKLKYIAKFAKVAKENRTYIAGDKIYKMWFNNFNYVMNPQDNQYNLIPEEYQETAQTYIDSLNNPNLILTTGKELVTNYLIDDLQETEDVDKVYNESSFMLSKMLPMSFVKTASSGGADLGT